MFDKLYRYHQWWYENRDHDHNGLAEYGSTDGTREAAAWESGMDNALRFDDATMVKNHEGAWSLNQESVDLNCYLYMEKVELASMAALIGRPAVAQQLQQEASKLRTQIQQVFFDKASGYFFSGRGRWPLGYGSRLQTRAAGMERLGNRCGRPECPRHRVAHLSSISPPPPAQSIGLRPGYSRR
jgi:putative isomerase